MADIKVDFNYAGIEQTEMQKYRKRCNKNT